MKTNDTDPYQQFPEPAALQKLRDAGFVITAAGNRLGYLATLIENGPDVNSLPLDGVGYTLTKPASAGGNSHFGKDEYVIIEEQDGASYTGRVSNTPNGGIHTNAPPGMVFSLYATPGIWYFGVESSFTNPYSVHNFAKPYPSIDGAVEAALDYYFGDPFLMNPPELFFGSVHDIVSRSVQEWFNKNWETEFEKIEVTSASYFTLLYWFARFEKPRMRLIRFFYRIRYANPYLHLIYRSRFHPRVWIVRNVLQYPDKPLIDTTQIYIARTVKKATPPKNGTESDAPQL